MTSNLLRTAALACLVSALLGAALLPSFALSDSQPLQIAIPLLSLALYLVILFTFQGLLRERFDFPIPRWLLVGLVAGHTALVAASVVDEIGLVLVPLSIILAWAGSLVTAVSLVVFGSRLLRIRRPLGVLGTTWAILTIVEGLLFGTIVFMASAILIAVVADLVLCAFFFRAAGDRSAVPLRQPA
jgi:hypothetical protein